jgi:hypothetical protein
LASGFDLERLVKRKAPFVVRRGINPYFDLERFFNDALRYQWMVRNEPAIESVWGAYYEFGVGQMKSMLKYWSAFKRLRRVLGFGPPRIFGFDTFTGLPDTRSVSDKIEGWSPGRYALSIEECRAIIEQERIPNVEFFQGLYQDTLTQGLREHLADFPPAIVNIDVDFYSSTVEVLQFIKPMLQPGVLIHFDDLWSFNGDPTRGELRAINEFNREGPFYLAPHWLGLSSRNVYVISKPLSLEEMGSDKVGTSRTEGVRIRADE